MAAGTLPSRDLVGHHQVLLRPVDRGGLVPPASLVVGQGLPLVAFLNGGVVVEGGRRRVALGGDLVDERPVDPGQALQGRGFRGDVGDGVRRARGLCRRQQGVVVAGVEEVAEGVGGGERPPQQAGQPGVGREHPDVVQAGPPGGQEQHEGLDLLRLGVAALAFPDPDLLGDHAVQAQGAQRLQHQREPGPGGHRSRRRHRLDRVRQESLVHRVGLRPAGPPGCCPRRSARFTAVSASTRAHKSR